MKFGKRQAALAFGTPLLTVALLGGVAAAAFQPQDVRTAAHPERVERAKPPLPKLEEILDKLVLEGKITATQREAILAAVQEAADAAKQKAPLQPKPEGEEKKRQHEQNKGEEKKREQEEKKAEQKLRIDVHKLLGDSLRSAVAYLGLDAKAVQQELRAGKSLGELAAATAGKTRQGLIDAIGAPARAKIDQLRTDGKLSEEQAARTKAQVDAAAAKIADAKNVRKVTPPGQAKRTR